MPRAAWLFAIAQHKLADYRRRGSTEDRMRARLGMEPVPVSAEDAEMIRELAERGSATAAQGADHLEALQHLAIVLDDRIVSAPFIDFRQAPNGLDGASGAQISGGLTPETARRIAGLLDAGPLPAELVLESQDAAGG